MATSWQESGELSKQHSLHWKSDCRGEEEEKWYGGGVEDEEAGRMRDWGGGGEDWE